jgi:hypothetical protein
MSGRADGREAFGWLTLAEALRHRRTSRWPRRRSGWSARAVPRPARLRLRLADGVSYPSESGGRLRRPRSGRPSRRRAWPSATKCPSHRSRWRWRTAPWPTAAACWSRGWYGRCAPGTAVWSRAYRAESGEPSDSRRQVADQLRRASRRCSRGRDGQAAALGNVPVAGKTGTASASPRTAATGRVRTRFVRGVLPGGRSAARDHREAGRAAGCVLRRRRAPVTRATLRRLAARGQHAGGDAAVARVPMDRCRHGAHTGGVSASRPCRVATGPRRRGSPCRCGGRTPQVCARQHCPEPAHARHGARRVRACRCATACGACTRRASGSASRAAAACCGRCRQRRGQRAQSVIRVIGEASHEHAAA